MSVGSVVEQRRLIPADANAGPGQFDRLGRRLEQFELLPRDRNVAHHLPSESTMWPRTSDLDPFGTERAGRTVGIAEGDAAVGLDAFHLADDVPAAIVASEANRLTGPEPEAGERRR